MTAGSSMLAITRNDGEVQYSLAGIDAFSELPGRSKLAETARRWILE
jgi:hypothetical protein